LVLVKKELQQVRKDNQTQTRYINDRKKKEEAPLSSPQWSHRMKEEQCSGGGDPKEGDGGGLKV
jgi:hypothetical protein